MSKFRTAVMTDAGASLMAAAFAEGFQMEFVKMLIGSGKYEENEKTVEALKKRTDLKNKRQEVGFSSAASAKENVMQLKALVTNENLDEGYHMTEIAVIAKKAGEGESEVLYSIAIADEADYLPSKENPVEIVQEFYTKVANSENISIKVGMSAVALAEDLDKMVNPSIEEADERENIEEGDDFFTILGKIKRFFSDLKKVAFSGKYQDLKDKPSIPTVVNNNTITEAGYALDARQANPNVDGSLAKQISTLNSGLILRPIYPIYTGKTAVSGTRDDPYKVVEDGYIQFWYQVNDNKNNNNCGIICYIDETIVHEYFEYHQAGAANENYSALFPVLRGQTAQFHIITDSVSQSAMIYYYPNRA